MNAQADLPWSEQFRIAARHWVDAEAAAQLLEDCKSATLAEKIAELGDMPYNRAEAQVKASPAWKEYIEGMVAARKEANRRKVQCEYLRMKFAEWNSHEATRRAEMKL